MSIPRLLLPCGLLLGLSGCHPSRKEILDLTNTSPNRAKLNVAENRCELLVPLTQRNERWAWGISGDNVCEYSIHMTIRNGSETYQLGYSNFNGGGQRRMGTLEELISSGQSDVWHVANDSGDVVGPMAARMNGYTLELSLTDSSLIKRIFAGRPETAMLETEGTMLIPHRIPVRVDYMEPNQRPGP